MKINLLLFLSILSLIILIQFGIKTDSTRTPAVEGQPLPSSEKDILDNLKKACDMSHENDSAYTICEPYKKTKEKIEKEADEYTKMITKALTPEVSAVSGFILKSFVEQKVTLEVKTPMGKPAVSISNNQTVFNWSIEHNF